MKEISIYALESIGEIPLGVDLAQIILKAMDADEFSLQQGDILVVTQKIVSKAENCYLDLNTIEISPEAAALAEHSGKDPDICQAILNESRRISRVRKGVIIAETHHGFVCANAGIDHSNIGREENNVLLLPRNPDQSAKKIAQGIQNATGLSIPVIINDTQGRPFRNGAVGVAVGVAGMEPLLNLIGDKDRYGRILRYSVEGVADELAAAATIIMGQGCEGTPVAIIRGCKYLSGAGKVEQLLRDKENDLYR